MLMGLRIPKEEIHVGAKVFSPNDNTSSKAPFVLSGPRLFSQKAKGYSSSVSSLPTLSERPNNAPCKFLAVTVSQARIYVTSGLELIRMCLQRSSRGHWPGLEL